MHKCICAVFCSAIIGLTACGGGSGGGDSELERQLRDFLAGENLSGDPSTGRTLPSIEDPLAQLGLKLFFTKSLGGDFDSACVTCHHPVLGGGDALPLSIGVGADSPDLLGPGRTHPDQDFTVPRNAPTTFNMALWDSGLFWDGRVESLGKTPGVNGADGLGIRTPDSDFAVADPEAGENITAAQSRFPTTSADEMRGFEFVAGGTNAELRSALEVRLASSGSWSEEFTAVFGDEEVTYSRIALAIGEYERSQVFVDTAWRAYVQGDSGAISDSAKRGALLFFSAVEQGGVDCASCHSGDFFTDERFWAIAAPQVGRGKGDGPTETNDYGRERESGDSSERFTFRTPTLLNVSATSPYLHSGAYDTLESVIRHHLDPRDAAVSFDPANVAPAEISDFSANRDEIIEFLDASAVRAIPSYTTPQVVADGQVADLVAFLESLTDPCVTNRSCLSPWIPDENTLDPDGNLLRAVDGNGNPL